VSQEHKGANRESRGESGVESPGASRESGEGVAAEQKVGDFLPARVCGRSWADLLLVR
jgi:hypothetical protein